MNKTPWYSGVMTPTRTGWYECHYANTAKDQESGAAVMRLWDGERWWQPCEDGRILAASFGMRFDRWRGMTTPNAELSGRPLADGPA